MLPSENKELKTIADINSLNCSLEAQHILLELVSLGAYEAFRDYNKLPDTPYNIYCERKRMEYARAELRLRGEDIEEILRIGKRAYELGYEFQKGCKTYVDGVQDIAKTFRVD